jgi:exosortase/archaeosortase family protein
MFKNINNYFDTKFYLRFALLFLVLYYLYIAFIGIITPGGSYNSVIVEHFNLAAWLRTTVLNGAHILTNIYGIPTVVTHDSITDPEGLMAVQMDWPCYGVVIMSFWFSYVVAKSLSFKTKLLWAIGGLFMIWFFNCLRIALLAISIKKQWSGMAFFLETNNHDLFNYFLYVLVFILILIFENKLKQIKNRINLPV